MTHILLVLLTVDLYHVRVDEWHCVERIPAPLSPPTQQRHEQFDEETMALMNAPVHDFATPDSDGAFGIPTLPGQSCDTLQSFENAFVEVGEVGKPASGSDGGLAHWDLLED